MQYRFARRNASIAAMNINVKAEQPELMTDELEVLEASKNNGKYHFEFKEKITEAIHETAIAAELTVETLSNGIEVNRLLVHFNENKENSLKCRAYGTEKNLLPEKELSTEEIQALRFGYCTQDGELITEERERKADGKKVLKPVIFANIANIA